MPNKKISQFNEVIGLSENAMIPIIQGYPLDDYIISKENLSSELLQNAGYATINYVNSGDTTLNNRIDNEVSIINDEINSINDELNNKMEWNGLNSSIDKLHFSGNTTTPIEKDLYWDTDEQTLSLHLPDGGDIQIGKEMFEYYQNIDNVTMVAGDVVSLVTITGNRKGIKLTDTTNESLSRNVVGMVTVPQILPNNIGRVTTMGNIHELDTDDFIEGESIYVSSTQKGKWSQTMASAPNYNIKIGTIEVRHHQVGIVSLSISTFPRLSDLSDVNGTPLNSTGQFPVWNNSTKVFDFNYNLNNYSNSGHTHYQLYQPNGTSPFVYTDNARNLHIDGNIIQNGSTYETHAEQVYTKNDTIILRDGAVGGLGTSYTGLVAKKYDGVNDGQLVFDSEGWARVGDVGNLQKLATIEENSVNGYLMSYNTTTNRLEGVNPTTLPTSTASDGKYVARNGGAIYHTTPWISAGTVSTSGTSVNGVGTAFTTAMYGAKIVINGESRIIQASPIITSTTLSVDSAFGQSYNGSAFVIYNAAFLINTIGSTTISNSNSSGGANALNVGGIFNTGNYSTYGVISGRSGFSILWSTGNNPDGTKDTALFRNMAGVLEINNGTAGQYRDLKLRNLYGDGQVIYHTTPFTSGTSGLTGVNVTSGTTVTAINGNSFGPNGPAQIGGKIVVNGEDRIILTVTNAVITVTQPFSQNWTNSSWAIYHTLLNISNGTISSVLSNSRNTCFNTSGASLQTGGLGITNGFGSQLFWMNGSGGKDLAIVEINSNTLELNNSSSGQYRDLILRNLTGATINSNSLSLPSSTYNSGNTLGIIYKNNISFISDFNYGYNGTVTTIGANIFIGSSSGNITMGSTAVGSWQSSQNTALGVSSLSQNRLGAGNMAIGANALFNNLDGHYNVGIGRSALEYNQNGVSNVAIGDSAGKFISGGTITNINSSNSIFIGQASKPLANSQTNQIVIGDSAIGNGSNTTTIGNINTIETYINGYAIVEGRIRTRLSSMTGNTNDQWIDTFVTNNSGTPEWNWSRGNGGNININGPSLINFSNSSVNYNNGLLVGGGDPRLTVNGTGNMRIASGGDRYILFQTNGSDKMKIQSDGNTGIGYSTGTEINSNKLAVNGSGYFNGTVSATSFNGGTITDNVTLNSTGLTLNGAATVFDDIIGDITSVKTLGTGVALNTTESTIDFTAAANLSDYAFINFQLTHKWKIGSVIFPHIHWEQSKNKTPNWLIQYRWQSQGSTKNTTWTNYKSNVNAFTYVSGTLNQISYDGGITPPVGNGLSDIIEIRVIRDTNNTSGLFTGADTYTGTVSISSIDIHIELDSLGSNTDYTK